MRTQEAPEPSRVRREKNYTHYYHPKGFLEHVANKFEWEVLPNAVFMDIGCGSAQVQLAQYILGRFPETAQVVAIDKDKRAINVNNSYAKIHRVEFSVGDVENSISLIKWFGSIDKVLSLNCFHMLYKPITAMANIFKILKPGGEAALVFCLRSGYAAWYEDMRFNSKWYRYCEKKSRINVPVTQSQPPSLSFYEYMLEKIGFQVVYLHKEMVSVDFESETDWKINLYAWAQSSFSIPENKKVEFRMDLCDAFLRHNPITRHGFYSQTSSFVTILVRKPLNCQKSKPPSTSD